MGGLKLWDGKCGGYIYHAGEDPLYIDGAGCVYYIRDGVPRVWCGPSRLRGHLRHLYGMGLACVSVDPEYSNRGYMAIC